MSLRPPHDWAEQILFQYDIITPFGWLATGRSAVWLARLLWEQEVDGSNPFAPMNELSNLGGLKKPAFSSVYTNVPLDGTNSAQHRVYEH